MADEQITEIAMAEMRRRLENGPYPVTFMELYMAGDRACGKQGWSYRLADRLLQAERRAGRIKQQSRGKWIAA